MSLISEQIPKISRNDPKISGNIQDFPENDAFVNFTIERTFDKAYFAIRISKIGTFKENLTERFKDDYINSSRMPKKWGKFRGPEKFVFEIDKNSLNIQGSFKAVVNSEIRLDIKNIKETLT